MEVKELVGVMTAEIHINQELLTATKAYAMDVLTTQLPENYSYHTADHTVQVVDAVREIGVHTGLDEDQIRLVQIAAWLHDLGYLHKYIGHEDESMKIARYFLGKQNAEERLIQRVVQLIESTKLEQDPRNTLEEVLKDADLYNLATDEALHNSQLIREEWRIFCDREFTDEEWDRFNYDFFREHEFFTAYAQERLSPSKKENIKNLKKALKSHQKVGLEEDRAVMKLQLEDQEGKIDKLKRKLKKIKKQRPERGIETMFRTTYRTHINLSDLADSKANILLSINAIVISIIFTSIFGKETPPADYMIVPSFILLAVCMTTIVFAILATRPKINSGVFNREDILRKETNLLFFGNFYRMDLDDYMWGIDEMMNDADYLYGSMAKDIYFLGKVLARKFRLLRIAYNIFMFGIGGSLLILMATYLVFG